MTLEPNVRASLCMMLSMAGFVVNDALVKSLADDVPYAQILLVRGGLLGLLIGLLIWRRGLAHRLREARHPMVLARATGELLGTVTFLAALTRLPFATISAILQALPLAVTLGAALFLKEAVGWRRWTAILIGFGGVLLIVRPGSIAFEPATLLVVLTVCFAAARDLCTRALPPALPSLLVSGATTLLIAVAGLLWCIARRNWTPMDTGDVGTLAAAAFCLFFGYQFIVLAMRTGDVAYVVPYRYTSLLFAIAIGLVVFGEVPDAWTIAGAAVVVATGLFTLYRELVSRRARATRAVVPPAAGVAAPDAAPTADRPARAPRD